MHYHYSGKAGILLCIGLFAAACSTKKEETSTPPADSLSAPVEKVEPPKADTVAAEPVKTEPVKTVPAKKEPAPVVVKEKPKEAPPVVVEKPAKKEAPPKEPELKKPEPVKETVVVETPPAKTPELPPVTKPEPVKTQPAPDTIKKAEVAKKPTGKPYYFKVLRKEDGKEVFGDLQLQETLGATQYQLVKAGQVIHLNPPRNKRGSYNIIALLPGYKEKSLIFLYNNPPIEIGPQNEEIITLVVDKAKAGDYIDFNNVHFFKNAGMLRPASKPELDQLVFLLKENPRYKIRIHGHCNGTQDRESYLLGTSTDFFAMNPKGNKKTTITAKELTEARAELVRDYLIQQGVETDRISTKGEGGKIPIYPESGTLGQYNDRVEIEFTKH